MKGKDYYAILGSRDAGADELKYANVQYHRTTGRQGCRGRSADQRGVRGLSDESARIRHVWRRGSVSVSAEASQGDFSSIFGGGEGFRGGGFRSQGFGGPGAGFEDLLSQMFAGSGMGGRRHARPSRGQDMEQAVSLGFLEAMKGAALDVQIPDGAGSWEKVTVRIPPGVSSGTRLRVRGKGGHSPSGAERGDLFLVIQVEEHPVFSRSGNDLSCDVLVPVSVMVLGDPQTCRSRRVSERSRLLGTQPGTRIRLNCMACPRNQVRRGFVCPDPAVVPRQGHGQGAAAFFGTCRPGLVAFPDSVVRFCCPYALVIQMHKSVLAALAVFTLVIAGGCREKQPYPGAEQIRQNLVNEMKTARLPDVRQDEPSDPETVKPMLALALIHTAKGITIVLGREDGAGLSCPSAGHAWLTADGSLRVARPEISRPEAQGRSVHRWPVW